MHDFTAQMNSRMQNLINISLRQKKSYEKKVHRAIKVVSTSTASGNILSRFNLQKVYLKLFSFFFFLKSLDVI